MKSLLLFFTIINFTLFAQNSKGYLGAKVFTTIESTLYNPLLYNIAKSSDHKDKFNGGLRISAGYLAQRNIAFCIEAGIDFSNINVSSYQYIKSTHLVPTSYWSTVPNTTDYYYYYYQITPFTMNVQTTSIMPKIEFSSKKSLLPMGLSQQIGIGFYKSKIIDKNYNVNIGYSNVEEPSGTNMFPNDSIKPYDEAYLKTHLYDYKNQNIIKSTSLMYALSIRTAISKHVMINYGFRYTISFTNIAYLFDKSNNQDDYLLDYSDIKRRVVNQRALNLITFNLGLTYVLFKN